MEGLVAKRYGLALFSVAVENQKVDKMKEEVESLLQLLNKDEELMDFLNHPKINVDDKVNTTEKIFKENIDKDLLGLIVVVLKKARQDYLSDILNYFLDEYKRYSKLVTAYVTSAVELQQEQKDKLKATLENRLNEKVHLDLQVDKSLIGGLIVRVGDNVIDNSINGKLLRLNKELRKIQLC